MGTKDGFMEDRSRLQGQPKRTICEYLRSCSMPVPIIYESLVDAKKSGEPCLARFENPQDYDGASNLGPTGTINFTKRDNKQFYLIGNLEVDSFRSGEKLIDKLLATRSYDDVIDWFIRDLHFYCRAMGITDHESFIRQSSFSFWRFIPGVNLAVIGDSAIEGRFHVTMQHTTGIGLINYMVIEPDGKLRLPLASDKYIFKGNHPYDNKYIPNTEFYGHPEPRLEEIARKAVARYREACGNERFDNHHAYLMEMQADDLGQVYLLQVHRTRNLDRPTFTLDAHLQDGQIEALEVRGTTATVEGEIFRLTYWGDDKVPIPTEQASCYTTLHPLFDEIMYRRRNLQLIRPGNRFCEVICAHGGRSAFFKSRISLVLDYDKLLTTKERKHRKDGAFINVHVIADGNRAYIKRIE